VNSTQAAKLDRPSFVHKRVRSTPDLTVRRMAVTVHRSARTCARDVTQAPEEGSLCSHPNTASTTTTLLCFRVKRYARLQCECRQRSKLCSQAHHALCKKDSAGGLSLQTVPTLCCASFHDHSARAAKRGRPLWMPVVYESWNPTPWSTRA
jgi:hypothetical protein